MEQPFHIYGSTDDGRSLTRRPIMLAQIPHVGAQIGGARVGIVAESAPAPAVESQPGAFSKGTRFYVDSQHTPPAPAEPETHWQPEPELQVEPQSQTELPSRSPGHRRRHLAHGHPRSPESFPADSPQPGAATGLSRLYEELASYAGLIVTLALMASGALLYWMIIAPSQAPIADYGNSYETFGSIGIEIPKFASPTTAPTTPPTMPLTKRQFAPPSELSAPPGTTAESAPELIRLPAQTPAPSDESEPVFNDASARAYPTTAHPHGWDPVRLRATDVAGENRAASASKPVNR